MEVENGREDFEKLLREKFSAGAIRNDRKYMVSVARMDFVKNIPLLLRAFKTFMGTPDGKDMDLLLVLPPHRPSSELYDQEEKTIRKLIDSLPPERVSVHWRSLPREEVKTLYKFADMFAVPSRHDGMPLTPFEYALANEGSGDIVLSDGIGAYDLLQPYAQAFQRENEESLVEALRTTTRSTEKGRQRRMEEMKGISRTITLHQWLTKVAAMLVSRYPQHSS